MKKHKPICYYKSSEMVIDEKYHYLKGTCCWYCKREYNTSRCVYVYCGKPLIKTIDHINPLSKSKNNSPRNKISCCIDCNTLKSNKNLIDFINHLENIQKEIRDKGHNMSKYFNIIINSCWKLYNKTNKKYE